MQGLTVALLCLLGAALAQKETGNLWAVLIAGSNGYYNYRHQADVCHAYHVLHNHGIPDERIIVMMYDDIANSQENPNKGVIINHVNGPNVYPGVPKDYTGELVTPENFMKVLTGEVPKGGSGKTLKSGPNDHVFVNFVDHGAPGILAFPDGELTVKQLSKTLETMNKKKMYKQMVWYVEACESGSMFQKHLSSKTNVFATTAANAHESSYACYWDDKLQTYLGDVYSVKWMEDSDKENLDQETLEKQYDVVKRETNTSHVMQYGDLALDKDDVGQFQGPKQAKPIHYPEAPLNAVPSNEAYLFAKIRTLNNAKDQLKRRTLRAEIAELQQNRKLVSQLFQSIAQESTNDKAQAQRFLEAQHDITNCECHHDVVKHFSKNCLSISKNPHTTRFVQVLVNMCEEGLPTTRIISAIDAKCAKIPQGLQNVQ